VALIDDIEFYGRAVDAGEMPRKQAAELLARDSHGGLTVAGAQRAIDDWVGLRDRMHAMYADVVDTIRAISNNRPVPEHVQRHARERAQENLLRSIRRPRQPADWWEDDPRTCARYDRAHFDRDED
jgi:hypothetical protein